MTLERKRKIKPAKRAQGLHLILCNPRGVDGCIGLAEIPGRLPRVIRLPGESLEQMYRRALASASGSGVLLAHIVYLESHP